MALRNHVYQYVDNHYSGPKQSDLAWCRKCKWSQAMGDKPMCGYALEEDHHTRQYLHGLPLHFGAECEEFEPRKRKRVRNENFGRQTKRRTD